MKLFGVLVGVCLVAHVCYAEKDVLEASRGCFQAVQVAYRDRLSDAAQQELGLVMHAISKDEEKNIDEEEKGAALKHFTTVLKRTSHAVQKNKMISGEEKHLAKKFVEGLKDCLHTH